MTLTVSFLSSRFATWQKSQDKNLNILRTKGAFEVKLKAFFIIFKGLWVAKNCFRPESVPLNHNEKCFLFHLKSSFCSRDIQIFLFPTSPQSFPVSHSLRGWFQINLKVYGVSICLNKNLITHFNWYLKKEKRFDIETLSIHRVLLKGHFHEKIMHKLYYKSQYKSPS